MPKHCLNALADNGISSIAFNLIYTTTSIIASITARKTHHTIQTVFMNRSNEDVKYFCDNR